MIAGAMVLTVGAGLLMLFKVDIPISMWLVHKFLRLREEIDVI